MSVKTDESYVTRIGIAHNCRCEVIQLPGKQHDETNLDGVELPVVPKLWRINVGKQGVVFHPESAYYNGVPDNILRDAVASLPDEYAYKTVEDTDESIRIHIFHGKDEAEENIRVSKILIDKKACKRIDLLPNIERLSKESREILYGTRRFVDGKNPDCLIDGELFDLTILNNPAQLERKIVDKTIRKDRKQCDNIVIDVVGDIDLMDIERIIKGRFNVSNRVHKVWVITNGEVIKRRNPNYLK